MRIYVSKTNFVYTVKSEYIENGAAYYSVLENSNTFLVVDCHEVFEVEESEVIYIDFKEKRRVA